MEEMRLSEELKRELKRLAGSKSLKNDMDILRRHSKNPFVKEGIIDRDGYIEFVTQFNEFINHRPKPFMPMIDRVMKL